jgi:hypothetical protein
MWVYKTAKFIEDERQHGLREFVENRSRRISNATTRAQAARLAKPYAGFLVTRHRNMRLIGDVRLHRDREVFVWYEVLPRGGEDYKVFSRYSQTIETSHFDRVDFERWYAEQSVAEAEALRPTPAPRELQRLAGGIDTDLLECGLGRRNHPSRPASGSPLWLRSKRSNGLRSISWCC